MPVAFEPEFHMTRRQLFQIRFAATAAAMLLLYLLLRWLWFPGGYFALSGIGKLLLLLVGVTLVVGPGLSTFLYKPGKRGLKFDLVVLACVEVVIIGWALLQFDARKPVFAVFAVDRFEAVPRAEIDPEQLAASPIARPRGFGQRLVYAALPTDAEVMNRLIDETVFMGMQDIDRRPEFWQPYPEGISTLLAAAVPLAQFLTADDARAGPVRRWLARQHARAEDYVYLPLRARTGDGVIIIDANIGYPVDVLAVDPWLAEQGTP